MGTINVVPRIRSFRQTQTVWTRSAGDLTGCEGPLRPVIATPIDPERADPDVANLKVRRE